MALNLFIDTLFLRGLFWTLLGVGFWIGGLVIAHYFWQRYRGNGAEKE